MVQIVWKNGYSMEERTNLNLKEGKGRVNMFSYDKCADVCMCVWKREMNGGKLKIWEPIIKINILYSISCNNL